MFVVETYKLESDFCGTPSGTQVYTVNVIHRGDARIRTDLNAEGWPIESIPELCEWIDELTGDLFDVAIADELKEQVAVL